MSFKIGLSSNPGKDRGKAEAAMKGDQNFKDALKEVLSEIGQCFENAQLIDVRCKEKAGDVKFEEEKRKAMEGNADIKALARALGFEVEEEDDDDDDYYGKKEEPSADAGDDDNTSFNFDGDDSEDSSFSFDDDDDDDDESGDEGDGAAFSFEDDDDEDDEDDGESFNFDDLDDD